MTNKLLPCPFCGGEAKTSETTTDKENKFEFGWIGCQNCRAFINYINNYRGKAEAIAAWNRRTEPENNPLTLDELRQMEGEAVWAVDGSGNQAWVLIDVDSEHRPNGIDKETGLWDGDFYGMTCGCEVLKCECKCPYGLHPRGWLAYDYPPNDNT